jgi:hypothetical protein
LPLNEQEGSLGEVKIQRQENPRPSRWRAQKIDPKPGSASEIGAGTNSSKTENSIKQGSLTYSDLTVSKQSKMNCAMTRCKKRSFIELNQSLYTMEVTALLLSFLIGIKNVFLLNSTLEMQNKNRKWQGGTSSLGSYIYDQVKG